MTIRTSPRLISVGLALALSGCDDGRRASPAGPSAVTPSAAGSIELAGTVSDATWRPLAGARVEVVDGAGAGLSATVGAAGDFRLRGAFDGSTRFRASKDGHAAATWPLPASCAECQPNWWLHFFLDALVPHADLTGSYLLTFTADAGCAGLPDDVRTRTYPATVTPASIAGGPANSWFTVTVGGGVFVAGYDSFMIGLAGERLVTDVGDWGHGSPGLVEQIAPNTYLTLSGGLATTTSDGAAIAGAFSGTVDRCELASEWGTRYSCEGPTVSRGQCLSPNHRLTLTRR